MAGGIAVARLFISWQTHAWADSFSPFFYHWGEWYEQGVVAAAEWKENRFRFLIYRGFNSDEIKSPCSFSIGNMYANGRGVPQNYVQAYTWLNIAASQGDQDVVKNRDIALSKMYPKQIEQGQALSREYFEKYGKK